MPRPFFPSSTASSRVCGGFQALSRIAVTIGPGSFTGIRIGVAAARAFGLVCRVPVVGVSTLSALAAPALAMGVRSPVVAAIDARHGNVYVQSFGSRGETLLGPALMSADEAARALGGGPLRVIGSGGTLIAAAAYALGVTTDTEGFHPCPTSTSWPGSGLWPIPRRPFRGLSI